MHILFITDNFPPEGNAPATRTYEHAKTWVEKGIKVTIITGAPNFPEGKIYDGYKNRWLHKEEIEGIQVWRVKTYITANEGFIKRILDFLSFMFSSFFFGIFTRKVDIVIGTSPQFFTVISAWALSKLKRTPFVFELRDMWGPATGALGIIKQGFLVKLFEKIEIFLYHQADLIISVTNSFKKEISDQGVSLKKIKVVTNGVDTRKYTPLKDKDDGFINEYNLSNKFIVGYIGTHGIAHALENIIEAASILKNEESIEFIFAGGGSERVNLEKKVYDLNLPNITLIPRQPKKKMQQLWSLCDISLVHLRNNSIYKSVIPSKIFESMAMGLPILICVPDGEATNLVEYYGAGIFIKPENPSELAKKILDISKDKQQLDLLSRNGKKAAINFNRANLAEDMLNHIKKLLT